MTSIRNILILGACYASGADAFSSPPTSKHLTALRSSNNYLDSMGSGPEPRRGPPPTDRDRGYPPPNRMREPPNVDLGGQIQDRQSNLWHRSSQSINEDPREFDMDRRYSQRPQQQRPPPSMDDRSMSPRRSWWESDTTSRVQGGSRQTYHAPYDRDESHIFFETDGRPLDVEFELWDGPNNTPTKMKVYSEDGRMRPFNAMVNNPNNVMRSNTLSVKNTGPMEFPMRAGVGSVAGVRRNSGGLAGEEGGYLARNDLHGFRTEMPAPNRRNIVQGDGALKTFPVDYSVEAVQVTIVTDGMPMNAKVELWGTSSHIKQIAEIYNDNGSSRPFSAIVDTPGGSNTIAITNTGPMCYPIYVTVEPVARMDGWNGEEQSYGGALAPPQWGGGGGY